MGDLGHRNRASLVHKIQYGVRHPSKVAPYLRRLSRDTWLRLRTRSHVDYYRAVMKDDTARNPESAVGSKSHERWKTMGQAQFDYLTEHGLKPADHLLEIGCGNLRAGRLFIDYLEPGHYYGIDISPDILFAAQETIAGYDLAGKLPHLTPVRDLRFGFLPDDHFDVVHAHSVFSHSPLEVIDECFAHIGRIMKSGGFFDFTFDRTTGREHQVLREDFYYRTETLVELAGRHGLEAAFMADWERRPFKQSKIRVTLPAGSAAQGT